MLHRGPKVEGNKAGQVQCVGTMFGSNDEDDKQQRKKEMGSYADAVEYKYNTAHRYGPPAAYPPQSTGWDDGAYKYPPRKPMAHHGHAGWDDRAYDEYPPQHGEASYYGGGGGYPPAQRQGYPPSRPSLPPPYQGGGQWDGYAGATISYMRWPKPAPPAGAYATYGAYHKHHGGYGGGGYGGGGYGYGNGKYTMGHRGKFKHYAHHQGKY